MACKILTPETAKPLQDLMWPESNDNDSAENSTHIRIWRINDEWWASDAAEPKQVASEYSLATGLDIDEIFEYEQPRLLDQNEMKNHTLKDPEEPEEKYRDLGTFEEHLALMIKQGQEFPYLFASADY